MNFKRIVQRLCQSLVLASALGFGFAMAQSEPTLNQIYATAQAGKLNDAQVMVQQVLLAHPKSGKAHFVRAELYARQGKLALARESLATAEALSPGLSFAKPEAVQALRAQLSGKTSANQVARSSMNVVAPAAAAPSSSSWALPLLLAGGVMVAGYLFFRRRTPGLVAQQPDYANQGGLSGPQSFGMGGGTMQNPYPQPGYPQAYPQQAGSGLGGRIMGGVATGLAVGAGVMAAEAIGKSLMGNHNTPLDPANTFSNNDYQTLNQNPGMGGFDFGVNDTGSWDDGGGADAGSDWGN